MALTANWPRPLGVRGGLDPRIAVGRNGSSRCAWDAGRPTDQETVAQVGVFRHLSVDHFGGKQGTATPAGSVRTDRVMKVGLQAAIIT